MVRRRRWGTALVAAVAVAVVAVGSQLLTTGRPDASSIPAQRPPAGSSLGSATLTVDGFRSGSHTYVVTVRSGDDKGLQVDYAEKTASGVQSLGGAGIDPADPRITWGHGGDSPVVVGVIPSASAQHRNLLTTTGDFGGYSSDVAAIPGTDYSAFAASYDKPLTGDAPIESALWFDSSGRPVDVRGGVGAVATVDGQKIWLTADGSEFGGDQTSSLTGATDTTSTAFGGNAPGAKWTVVGLLKADVTTAATLTAVLSDGSTHLVTPVALGERRVFAVTVAASSRSPHLTDIRWSDSKGLTYSKVVRG